MFSPKNEEERLARMKVIAFKPYWTLEDTMLFLELTKHSATFLRTLAVNNYGGQNKFNRKLVKRESILRAYGSPETNDIINQFIALQLSEVSENE